MSKRGDEQADSQSGDKEDEDLSSGQSQVKKRAKFIKDMLDNMSEEELTRFEFFSRSHLPRNRVRDIMTDLCGPNHSITDEMAIVVSGLTKQYIGELTDTAADIMKEEKVHSKLQPAHIKEAFHRMQMEGKVGHAADQAHFFQMQPAGADTDLLDPYIEDDDEEYGDSAGLQYATEHKDAAEEGTG